MARVVVVVVVARIAMLAGLFLLGLLAGTLWNRMAQPHHHLRTLADGALVNMITERSSEENVASRSSSPARTTPVPGAQEPTVLQERKRSGQSVVVIPMQQRSSDRGGVRAHKPDEDQENMQLQQVNSRVDSARPAQPARQWRRGGPPYAIPRNRDIVMPPNTVSQHGTNARLLVLVVTGGTKTTTVSNREAVLETWAAHHPPGCDVLFVTDAVDIPEHRVLRLPPPAEEGGANKLGRKVLLMWEHVARKLDTRFRDYDFFMKADDDTYVHMEKLARDLALLDSSAPLFLGRKQYGGSVKGTLSPNPLIQRKNYMKFAHGGAGYILSRGILSAVDTAGSFAACVSQPPHTVLEDAKLAACLYSTVGADTVHIGGNVFGNLDVFGNRHGQHLHAEALASWGVERFAVAGSFHSVQAETTRAIFKLLQEIPSADTAALVARDTKDTAEFVVHFAAGFSGVRACTLPWRAPAPTSMSDSGASATVTSECICQQPGLAPALQERAYTFQRNFVAPPLLTVADRRHVRCRSGFACCVEKANRGARVHGEDIATTRAGPRQRDLVRRSGNTAAGIPYIMSEPLLPLGEQQDGSIEGHSHSRVVMVAVRTDEDVYTLPWLLTSLETIGVCADIALFLHRPLPKDHLFYSIRQGSFVVEASPGTLLTSPEQTAAVMGDFLTSHPQYTQSLAVDATTVLQGNPFAALDMTHVSFFVQQPAGWTTKLACALPKNHQINLHPRIHPFISVGPAAEHARVLTAIGSMRQRYAPNCTPQQLLSEVVWGWHAAAYARVAVYAPWDGPLVDLSAPLQERWWSIRPAHSTQRHQQQQRENGEAGRRRGLADDALFAALKTAAGAGEAAAHTAPATLGVTVHNYDGNAVVLIASAHAALTRCSGSDGSDGSDGSSSGDESTNKGNHGLGVCRDDEREGSRTGGSWLLAKGDAYVSPPPTWTPPDIDDSMAVGRQPKKRGRSG